MSCPNCHTLSCYVCRQVIQGYDHFNQNPHAPTTSKTAKKCLLWDSVEQRHAEEVKRAAEQAMEEYKRDHPEVDHDAIKVDIPVAPPQPAAPGVPGHGMGMGVAQMNQLAGFGMMPHLAQPRAYVNPPPNMPGMNAFRQPVHQHRHVAHQPPQPQPPVRAQARRTRHGRGGRGAAAAARAAADAEMLEAGRRAREAAQVEAERHQAQQVAHARHEQAERERLMVGLAAAANVKARARRAPGGSKKKRG